MGTDDRAQDVVGIFHRCHPVTHRFIDGVPQGSRTTCNWPHFGPHGSHDEHIELLPTNILFSHVHHTGKSKSSTSGGGRHAMLTRPSLGDDSFFPHPQGQQRLTDRIVNFVSPGVVQIFAFEVNLSPAAFLRQSLGKIEGIRSSDKCSQ